MKTPPSVNVVTVVLASMLCGACAHTMAKKSSPTESATSASNSSSAEPSLRENVMRSIPQLRTVHFDYDSAFLKPEARTILVANAQWLKEHDGMRVQVSGNCDQRGTVEYNLALGQRRAAAVREYYLHMGVPGDYIATISYGKEKPVCEESNEACWSKNRRAETLAASSTAANSQ